MLVNLEWAGPREFRTRLNSWLSVRAVATLHTPCNTKKLNKNNNYIASFVKDFRVVRYAVRYQKPLSGHKASVFQKLFYSHETNSCTIKSLGPGNLKPFSADSTKVHHHSYSLLRLLYCGPHHQNEISNITFSGSCEECPMFISAFGAAQLQPQDLKKFSILQLESPWLVVMGLLAIPRQKGIICHPRSVFRNWSVNQNSAVKTQQ